MQKVTLESVVVVHGQKGSVATIHFSDARKSSYISGPKQSIYIMVTKRIKNVMKDSSE